MNETTSTPSFSVGEPNIASSRKKNEDGKCCFYNCDNNLSESEYRYMGGFKACKECGKKVMDMAREMSDDAFFEHMERVLHVLDKKEENYGIKG